jgi:prepilin-type N-terminal cleavage/methylation domain-containing protein
MTAFVPRHREPPAGYTLIELMFVVVILSIGILATAKLFPLASRQQIRDRMRTAGNYYAQDKIETLRGLGFTDPALEDGRHPAGNAAEVVGPAGSWHRFYQVEALTDPLPNLKRVSVTVYWKAAAQDDSTAVTTYIGR